VSETNACHLHPHAFFVAWNGVLALAYSGFPQPLVTLKEKIGAAFTTIAAEGNGSKWPKTTLAAVKDGKRLSLEQLKKLKAVCSKHSRLLTSTANPPILCDRLALVTYENRALSRFVSKIDIPLKGALDTSLPSTSETQRVFDVLSDFDDSNLDNYWFHASGDKNRASHYDEDHPGSTLVWPFARKKSGGAMQGTTSWGRVHAFFKDVEAALPGMYVWMPLDSLHITIRAIHS
jgi:hypothetical protein